MGCKLPLKEKKETIILVNGVDRVNSLIRSITQALVKNHGKYADVEIKEISDVPPVLSHWMSLILASGPSIKIIFKLHFKMNSARKLASTTCRIAAEDITAEQALDYFREFCNLTAGIIKGQLNSAKIEVGISLPVITRGFDEVFASQLLNPQSVLDWWIVSTLDFEIGCTTIIELLEPVDLSGIVEHYTEDAETQGDVEFL